MKTCFFTSLFLVFTFLCSASYPNTIKPTDSEIQVIFQTSLASCVTSNDGTLFIEDIKGVEGSFTIFLDDEMQIFLGEELSALSYGDHKITILMEDGTTFEEFFTIDLEDSLSYQVTEQVKIFKGDSIKIDLEIFDDYDKIEWFLAPAISDRTLLQPVVNPDRDQIYKAEVLYDDVCTTLIEVYVEVDPNRYVFFPSIFSPNNDGINDVFAPNFGTQVAAIRRFYVIDRWGRVIHKRRGVFEQSVDCQWNGKAGYEALSAGVYTYFCEVEFRDGRIVKYEGAVTLML